MRFTLGPVMVGTPAPFRGEEMSAIFRRPADGPVAVEPLGLVGDRVADTIHHGGIDMAIHHYPHDHYPFWRERFGEHELLERPGAFGENISTFGLKEDEASIGDRFRLGSALVEISQGRQPCWKIDHKFGTRGMTAAVVETARCGWYYRVLEPGEVAAGDALELVERPHPEWTVARVFRLLVSGRENDPDALAVLAGLPELSQVWREKARKKLG